MMPPGVAPIKQKTKQDIKDKAAQEKEKLQTIVQTEKKNPLAALDDIERTMGLKATSKDYEMKTRASEKVSGDGDDDDEDDEDDELF